jgi:uncharacterized membrane protein (UPF0136 family)
MTEYLKPWKLAALMMGLIWLIAGAFITQYPDWDVGVSLLMGVTTYLAHPWALRFRSAREVAGSVVLCVLCVDVFYAIYWQIKNPYVLQLMRSAQWPLSLCYYLTAVAVWNYGEQFIETSSSLLGRFLRLLR